MPHADLYVPMVKERFLINLHNNRISPISVFEHNYFAFESH